ncbi:MAG TPA: carbon storage regulator [Pirellulales bacterium]|jgi:carbon storage regulator|nr:carbon storage regulator [Pirellulales bacterium]
MLVLSRKRGEAIRIHEDIVVTVIQLGRGRVQLGIQAPANVAVNREEIHQRLQRIQTESKSNSEDSVVPC